MPDRILDTAAFLREAAETDNPLALFRDAIGRGKEHLKTLFEAGEPVSNLVQLRAEIIDLLLRAVWERQVPLDADVALIAVGGYGRGELHPNSDIDLLILLGEGDHDQLSECLGSLLTFFWDIGLEIGHSVRTLQESIEEAERDITVATNLMESRLLSGPLRLFNALRDSTGPDKIWPIERFFQAKWEEQKQRHLKFDGTVSNLEPNIKESPGGLRDIQMIGWVVKRHFRADTLDELVSHGFLTKTEFEDLMEGQELLWRIRFALHLLTGRHEDRILFDYQRTLAEQFGYSDDESGLGVEQFMQHYYQIAIRLNRMNEMLLQLFQEYILLKCHLDEPKPINPRFHSRSGFLEITSEDIFERYPLALLEMFLIMEQHPELYGVRASTIRLARSHRHLIDDKFRADPATRHLFMEILRQPRGIAHELRRMNRYGILARYIPEFSNIVGRMQYDLFHAYTVDEHTLFLIRNLRRFAVPDHRAEFPLCSDIMERLPKHELIYLAALFHDIAKGRGGDHSTLGAEDALKFCRHHDLSEHESLLVSWLVEKHLLMSITAQRKDTSDPDVIRAFAEEVKNPVRLDYLYLLTVADIRSTDPKKWNSWKNSLLRDLYMTTKQALLRGLENLKDRDEVIQNKQAGARHLLKADGISPEDSNAFWLTLSLEYFLHHTWEEIAWQSKMVLTAKKEDLPLVLLRKSSTRGGNEVFIYTTDRDNLFALTTSLLDQLGLNILGARIESTHTGYSLSSYMVLENDGSAIDNPGRREEICATLKEALSKDEIDDITVTRRVPRQMKHFTTPTRIDFVLDGGNQRTIMKLVTDDRPGLLSQVGYAFTACGLRLINAKIATIGAVAEDTFFITDREDRPLDDRSQFKCIEKAIRERLDANSEV
ncbi:[protein-PII] uridylyltransferase [Solemya velesiana gill symbiont]|uniref:Bifunctional uridylyltransferase/uridylyl-removing enzyme n=1 Tax=Solemya velesiana gill symbiont TaxID=1918948 RepID=A0A1T2KW78_9GAMM|nr:[protein-PII] uridylyltransferase [Solemya velesiana gill symbiont]OOZ37072.1 [protein-PII] uridylyltransferase [Solemya velesiana gill symbiont]